MQHRTDFLPEHLLAPAQAAYENYLSKAYTDEYLSWDLYLKTADGRVERPNHGLIHSLLVAANMPLIIDFYKNHASDTCKLFFAQYTTKHLRAMQVAAIFSVSGRQDETGFSTEIHHYKKKTYTTTDGTMKSGPSLPQLRYKEFSEASGAAFEQYCKKHPEDLELSDEEIQHYKTLIIDKGDPGKVAEATATMNDAARRINDPDNYHLELLDGSTDLLALDLTKYKVNTLFIHGAENPRKLLVIENGTLVEKGTIELEQHWISTLQNKDLAGNLLLSNDEAKELSKLERALKAGWGTSKAVDVAYLPKYNPMDYHLLHKAHNMNLFRCHDQGSMKANVEEFKKLCRDYDDTTKKVPDQIQQDLTQLATTFAQSIKSCGDRLFCSFDENGISDYSCEYDANTFGPLSHSPEKAIQHINKELSEITALNAQRTQLQAIDADLKLSMPTTSTDIQKCTEQDTALTALIAEYKKLEGKRSSIITSINAPDLDLTTLTTQAQAQRTVLQTVKNQLTALSTTQTALQTQCTTMLQETALDPKKLKTLNEELSKQKTTIQTLEQQNQLATIEAFIKKQQENLIALKDRLSELQELKAKLEIQKAEAKTLELEISNYDTAVAKANGMLAALNQEQQDTTLIFSGIKNNLNLKRPNIAYQVALGVVMAVAVAAVIFGIVLLALLLSPTPLDLPSWIKAIGTIGSIICGAAGFLGIAGTAIGLRLFDSANAAVDQTMTNINQREQIALQAVSDKIAAQQQLITGLQTTGTTIIQPKQADLAAKKIAIDAFTPKINAIDKEITALLNGQEPEKTTGADDVLGAGTAGTAALLVGFGGGPLGGAGANPPAVPSTPLSGDGTPNLGGTPSPLPMDPM